MGFDRDLVRVYNLFTFSTRIVYAIAAGLSVNIRNEPVICWLGILNKNMNRLVNIQVYHRNNETRKEASAHHTLCSTHIQLYTHSVVHTFSSTHIL